MPDYQFPNLGAIGEHPEVTEQQIQNLLNQIVKQSDSGFQAIVIASANGFDETARGILTHRNQKNWRKLKNVCLILFDISQQVAHYDTQDTRSYNFLNFLEEHGRDEQFEITLNWVTSQLPLVTSLGSRAMAEEKGFHEPTVQKAFRVAANQFGLTVDETQDFGLVISSG